MKKLLSLIVCFFVAKTCFSQWPVPQNLGSDSTLVSIGRNFGGGIKGNLINVSYSDTTAANLTRIRQYAGGQIFTTGDTSLWLRSIGANKWVKLAGSAGSTNIYNSNGTFTSNRTASGNNLYNIAFDAVTTFRAEANAGTGKISSALVSTDSIFFQPNEGIFIIDSLASGASTDSVLVWTQATGRVKKRSYSSFTPTLQQVLTAGSTSTGNSLSITGGTNVSIYSSVNNGINLNSSNNMILEANGGGMQIGSVSDVTISSSLILSALTNLSTQDRLLGIRNSTGGVGNITLGSGLSLSSGVLNTSGTVPTPISSLTAATGTNNIDNGTRVQQWNWNTLANNSGLVLNSTSTTAAGNAQTLLYISSDGTNATSSQTTYGQQINNAHDGTSSTNVGIKVAATNATNNYAIIVPASSGSVGIGTSTPTEILHVVGNIKGTNYIELTDVSAPSTPSSGFGRVYVRADSLRFKNDGGTEFTMGTGGGGVTTLAAIGSSANANGATISGSTLNLEPASASFGGVVTTGTQTFAGAKTFTGQLINSLTGAASTPSFSMTGNPYTAGTATTNHPLHYLNGGAAPSTWSTAGTYTGINAVSGFTGNFLDYHVNGGASVAYVNSEGTGYFNGVTIGKYGGAKGFETASSDLYFVTGGENLYFRTQTQGFNVKRNGGVSTDFEFIYGGNTGYFKTGSHISLYGSSSMETRFGSNGTENYLTINTSGYTVVNKRLLKTQGADVASVAGAISLGADGNTFEITGTNSITLISNVGWQNGSEVTLIFTSTATLTDGTANSGTDIGMELTGNTNFTAAAGAVVKLVLSEIGGTQRWRAISISQN